MSARTREALFLLALFILFMAALGHAVRGWNATPQPFPSDLQLPTLEETF